jgi:opacity protein-like surface antigen
MKSIFILTLLFSSLISVAQINKDQWLVGGNGTLSFPNPSFTESKFRTIEVNGNGGIFLLNRLAAGIRFGYSHIKESGTVFSNNQYYEQTERQINTGPFVRYYFLPTTKRLNLLAEASYYRGWAKSANLDGYSKSNRHGYAFSAGPSLFLAPNIALEMTLNYEHDQSWYKSSALKVKIGFQIHLGKIRHT